MNNLGTCEVLRRLPCALSASSFSNGDPRCWWFLSLGLRQSKFGSYLQVYGIFACFFWSPNSFLVIFNLMLIVELRRLWGILFRNIHETTMEWSECGAAPVVSERGTSLEPGGARDGGHSFCFVLRWQLVVHADLKPYSFE